MKFTWLAWDFDCDGEAYVIAKKECPLKVNVPDYIVEEDRLHPDCKAGMVVEEGICKFQVRSDWDNHDGPMGWYYVKKGKMDTKGRKGWFPIWIVRKSEWY